MPVLFIIWMAISKSFSVILVKFLHPQAVELCDVIDIHETVLQKEMLRPEVMLAISICEHIFYCGTCHSIALLQVIEDLYNKSFVHVSAKIVSRVVFWGLHNLRLKQYK